MDYEKYFKQLQQDYYKLEIEKNANFNIYSNKMSTIYLDKIISHIEINKTNFIQTGIIEVNMGKCLIDCTDNISKIIDIKIKNKLPNNIKLYKNVYDNYKCESYNPGFLGLYNLYTKNNDCISKEFSYIIKLN